MIICRPTLLFVVDSDASHLKKIETTLYKRLFLQKYSM